MNSVARFWGSGRMRAYPAGLPVKEFQAAQGRFRPKAPASEAAAPMQAAWQQLRTWIVAILRAGRDPRSTKCWFLVYARPAIPTCSSTFAIWSWQPPNHYGNGSGHVVDFEIVSFKINIIWRRRRDSNPRYRIYQYDGLANRWFQPLTHVSGSQRRGRAIAAVCWHGKTHTAPFCRFLRWRRERARHAPANPIWRQ